MVRDGLGDREALDSLCPPLGTYLLAGDAPYLLGVSLKKRFVEFLPEAVDKKLFQVLLVTDRPNHRLHVAQPDPQGPRQTEFLDGVAAQADRVVEEAPQEIDARLPLPHQHYEVSLVWVSRFLRM